MLSYTNYIGIKTQETKKYRYYIKTSFLNKAKHTNACYQIIKNNKKNLNKISKQKTLNKTIKQ
ncbi:hypothetical protein HPHPH43_1046 [Helicobacter pylori Hp H-43]|nr:hypothetical protein HPHPH43_1046 [Helicobacter pylori Hp H-43]